MVENVVLTISFFTGGMGVLPQEISRKNRLFDVNLMYFCAVHSIMIHANVDKSSSHRYMSAGKNSDPE